MQETGSQFALPVEVLLHCGLRLSYVVGLQGKDIDIGYLVMHIKGKDGQNRTVHNYINALVLSTELVLA